MFLNEARIEEVKNVLYHHYKTDVSFCNGDKERSLSPLQNRCVVS